MNAPKVIFTGYVDAIQTLCGLSTGSTTTDSSLNIPVIYQSKENAEAAIAEMIAEYEQDIADNERDEDDCYEGALEAVHVLGDGTVFFPDLGQVWTAAELCGCSKAEVDMNVLTNFSAKNCYDHA